MMRGLWLGLLGAAFAFPAAAQTPELTLQCPEQTAGFTLQGRQGGACDYIHPSGAQAIVRRGALERSAPSSGDIARLDTPAPEPFEGDLYHLGEGGAGDRRLAIWRAGPETARLEIEIRYVIPRTARSDVLAFAAGLAEANGLVQAGEDASEVECPPAPQGFRAAERLTGEQAGAAVRFSCAYLRGDIFAFYYAPRDVDLVLSTFEEQLSGEARAVGPFPGMPPAERLVLDNDVYRGVWMAGEGVDARAVEVDWVSEEERAQAAALIRAVLG